MHDMKYELPPQKKWPHGVHPPGNPSGIATPTMEKLAVQGNNPIEQKEVGFVGWLRKKQELNSNHHPDCPAVRFGRAFGSQVAVIVDTPGSLPPVRPAGNTIPRDSFFLAPIFLFLLTFSTRVNQYLLVEYTGTISP